MTIALTLLPFALFLVMMALVRWRWRKDDPWSHVSQRTSIIGIGAAFFITVALSSVDFEIDGVVGVGLSLVPLVLLFAGLFFFLTGMAQRGHREREGHSR